MLSYEVYKILHLAGIFSILVALSASIFHVMSGGTKATNHFRKKLAILHGVGLLVTLVAGFGMLARLGIMATPGWVITKMVIWLVLGMVTAILYRKAKLARPIFWLVLVLSILAAYMAIYKPM